MHICDVLITVVHGGLIDERFPFSDRTFHLSSRPVYDHKGHVLQSCGGFQIFSLISKSLMQIKFHWGIKNSHCKHDLKRLRNCCGDAKSRFQTFLLVSTLLSSRFYAARRLVPVEKTLPSGLPVKQNA